MKSSYRLLAAILALVMAVSVLAALMTVMSMADDSNIASDKPVTVKAFDTAEMASHTPRQFTEGTPVGIRLGLGAPFNKFTLCMPTWGTRRSA